MSDHRLPVHAGVRSPAPPVTASLADRDRHVTPDGVPLAGWGRRLVAFWLDGIVVAIAAALVALPVRLVAPEAWDVAVLTSAAVEDWWPAPKWTLSAGELSNALATLAVGAAYSILLTSRVGWTLGKRALGIRVRHREHERLATLGEAAARWSVQLAPAALVPVPTVGGAAGLWTTIDGLWPLWDARRQAIHDKVAQTSVVRG